MKFQMITNFQSVIVTLLGTFSHFAANHLKMLQKLSQRPNFLDSQNQKTKQKTISWTLFSSVDVESFRRWLIAFFFDNVIGFF